MSKTTAKKKAGRPRSQASKASILDAVWKLLKTQTLKDLSIEAIARESKVGKATIYRWWSSKEVLAMDAFVEHVLPITPFPEDLSAYEAISMQMSSLINAFSGDYGSIVAQLIAAGQSEPNVLASYRERFLDERRTAAKAIIEKGIECGEFDPKLDLELAVDILYGPIYFRLFVAHLPLDTHFARELPRRALMALCSVRTSGDI